MQGRIRNIVLLTALIWGALTFSAYAYTQVEAPSAWRTTATLTGPQPTYEFQSTSAYAPTMHTTVYAPGASSPSYVPSNGPRRNSPWDDPEDDTELGQMYTPVGSPLVLLGMAMIYLVCKVFRRRKVKLLNR